MNILFFILGILSIPMGMVIFGLFKPYSLSFRSSKKVDYSINFGFEIAGVYQCLYWFTIEKAYFGHYGNVEHAEIIFDFWAGNRYWAKRNTEAQRKLEEEDDYFAELAYLRKMENH